MTEPSQAANPPPDIGSTLRQARTKRGQSLDTVFQRTRIPKKFIEALESNAFDVFPARVYLQGFLKTYCDYLEVDFAPLWDSMSPPKPKTEAPQAEAPQEKPAPPPRPAETAKSPAPDNARPIVSFPPGVLFAALGIVAAAAVAAVVLRKPPAPPARPAAAPPPRPVPPPAPARSREPLALKITFVRESWVRLRADGQLRFEGRAPAGYAQEWKAVKDFDLRASSPDDVAITLDGRPYALPSSLDSSGDYKIVRTP